MAGVAEAGGVKALLFHRALESKRYWLHAGGHLEHRFWDGLVFAPLRARMLGRIRRDRFKGRAATALSHQAVPGSDPQVSTAVHQQGLHAIIRQRPAGAPRDRFHEDHLQHSAGGRVRLN